MLYKHKNLSFYPQYPSEILDVTTHTYKPRAVQEAQRYENYSEC